MVVAALMMSSSVGTSAGGVESVHARYRSTRDEQVGELPVVHEDAYLLPGGDIGELGLGESGEQEYGRTQFARRMREDESTVVAAQRRRCPAAHRVRPARKSVGAQVELCVRQ